MSSEVIENVGLFDTTLNACEDYDYWLRVIAKGFTPKFSNMGLVYYRKHKSSMSSNKNNQYHHDALLHIRLFKLLYEDKKNNIENNLASSAAFVCGLLTTLSRLRENSEEHIDELMNLVRPSFDNLFSNLNDQRLIYNYEFMYYLMKLNELSILYRLDKNIYDYLVILNEEYLKRYHMENNFKILIQSIFSQNIKNINKSNLLSLFMQQSMTHFKNFLQNS